MSLEIASFSHVQYLEKVSTKEENNIGRRNGGVRWYIVTMIPLCSKNYRTLPWA